MSCHAASTEISKGPRIIRAGLLKRFKKGFLSKGFKVVYAELTDDSYFLWYRDQSSYKREGAVLLTSICDFLAVGPYTRSIPGRPNLPKGASERHIIAIPSTPSRDSTVHWFLCFNDNDLNDWMTSISSVLPPLPPPSDPPPESADLKDPPPPYPGGIDDTEIKPPPPPPSSSDVVATEVKTMNGDLVERKQQPSANKCETVTKEDVAIAAAGSAAAVSAWGWSWGWGGGWGCGGWGCFDFGPNPMSSSGNQLHGNCMDMNDSGMDARNGGSGDGVQQNTNECGMSSDQVTEYADYDGTDIDPGYDVMCDGGFDAGFDAGGFDMGFSIGF